MLALMPSMSYQFAVDVYARTASTLGLRSNLGRLHLTQPQVSPGWPVPEDWYSVQESNPYLGNENPIS